MVVGLPTKKDKLIRVHLTSLTSSSSFCLIKKKQKNQDERPTPIFYRTKCLRYAA